MNTLHSLAIAAGLTATALASPPVFTDLGTARTATGVTDDGALVTGFVNTSTDFKWTRSGGPVTFPGSNQSQGVFCSGDGSVIASHHLNGTIRTAATLNADNTWTFLPSRFDWAPNGTVLSYVTDISRDGTTIVGRANIGSTYVGAVWRNGVPYSLYGQGQYTHADAVSGDGRVVVGFEYFGSFWNCRWIWNDETQNYDYSPISDNTQADLRDTYELLGVSDSGEWVIGGFGPNIPNALIWSQATGFTDLGAIDALEPATYKASCVSDDGNTVLGNVSPFFGVAQAWIWKRGVGMQPLKDYLVAQGLTGIDSYVLTSVRAMSHDGRYIVGNYGGCSNCGFTGRAYMIDMGEPGSACPADFNQDGGVDGADVQSFFVAWEASDASADVNQDGGIDGGDVESFFAAWEAGGCQ
ncbi:MAG: hypothetical protein JSR77_14720 [Planctomycetes bacterium]|nr:hypothetical protein [Planctomycetota bacterium]